MISIIVPIHNSIKYIKECMESILRSTYSDIEIICIDSGNDGTGEYLQSLALHDSRLRYVWDENNSYGYKVNTGIRLSCGEYIGIVDSDDYIADNMYEILLKTIEDTGADFVRCDYYSFYNNSKNNEMIREYTSSLGNSAKYNRIINSRYEPDILFTCNSCIWTGLYKKQFLKMNRIALHESQGASFQDTGMSILSLALTSKAYFIQDALYYYRSDNPDSSTKSNSKIYTIKEEWDWIDYQVKKHHIANLDQLYFIYKHKIRNYDWNINRLSALESLEFSNFIKDEIQSDIANNKREYIFERLCKESDEIQIYGAGIWGNRVWDYLDTKALSYKVSSFVVSEIPSESVIKSVPVKSILSGYTLPNDSLIIIAISGDAGKEIYQKLIDDHYHNVVLIDNDIKKYISSELKRYNSFESKDTFSRRIIAEYRDAALIKLTEIFCPKNEANILYIGMKDKAKYSEKTFIGFSEFGKEAFLKAHINFFDLVFIYDIPVEERALKEFISRALSVMKEHAKLCIFADNKLGLDALCNISEGKQKRYTRSELRNVLISCGIKHSRFCSVFPGRILPQILIPEDAKINEDTALRYNQMFYYPEDCIIPEQELFKILDSNTDIHSFAPAFFIECSLNREFSDIEQISLTMHRNTEKATCTIVRNEVVEKIGAYTNSDLTELRNNLDNLCKRGVRTAQIFSADRYSIVTKKIDGITGDMYLRGLLCTDIENFYKELDRFVQLIEMSSDITNDDTLGCILDFGYIDLIPLNTIFDGNDFVVIDQEYVQKNLPLKAVIYRMLNSLYSGHQECEEICPITDLYERYDLSRQLDIWKQYQDSFRNTLYGDNEKLFTSLYLPNKFSINRNQLLLEEISSNNTFNNRHNPYGIMIKKTYRIGYCAGVFDMFHIGHLNLLKSAKDMCDYLIVGVVRDEDCEKSKHKLPIIPFEQRLEIVRSCKYADFVSEIPSNARSSIDAWEKYHFDAQFSGSDYENNPYWLRMRDELRKRGSDMIFFPYTEDTNSTELREKIHHE